MLRYALLVAMTLCPALAFAQAPQLVDAGKLTWGTSATFPPFEYMQNTTPVGFDVVLVAALRINSARQRLILVGNVLYSVIEGCEIRTPNCHGSW